MSSTRHEHRLIHLGLLALILLAAYMSNQGVFTSLLDVFIHDHVDQVNRQYLKTSMQESSALFEIISAIKATLALLGSSSGGISFFINVEIQLGQVLTAIFDTVNWAWIVSLAALSSISVWEMMLDISRWSMEPVLTLFFVGLGVSIGLQHRLPGVARSLGRVSRLLLMAALLVHFVVPLTVYASAAAGQAFFGAQRADITQGFRQVHEKIPKKSTDGSSDLHDQVKGAIHSFKQQHQDISGHALTVSGLAHRHSAMAAGEYILLPLVITLFMLLVIRRAIGQALFENFGSRIELKTISLAGLSNPGSS